MRTSLGYSKLEDDEFLKCLTGFDIVGLVETHCGPENGISIPGYRTFSLSRPKSKNANKYHGGIAILYKNELRSGIKHVKTNSVGIWVKLDKHFFASKQLER